MAERVIVPALLTIEKHFLFHLGPGHPRNLIDRLV
ncbi:Uncharacterised protein [Mycobacteroides abscessus subsp. abscessus]|nr:Uncharacterised protein [Mycobacteroides abscessus subsp. abscessus]